MANTYASRDYIYDDRDAGITAMRNKMGEAAIESYFRQFLWEELAVSVSHAAPCGAFLQNGRTDKELPERVVRKESRVFRRAQTNRIL